MADTTVPGTLPETRAHVEPTSATASPSLPAAAHTAPDAEERMSGLVVPLYLRVVVQIFPTDGALVKTIAKFTGMNRKQRNDLAKVLAGVRREGLPVARLKGLALAGHGAAVVAILPDGRPGIGAAITEEPPADLAAVTALCAEEAEDLQPGFMLLAVPAGVMAGGLQ